eukprot:CAMPEP_0171573426 /NCGR_PEP_ID=MMETSP0961-20121227/4754_1 /TAXON_ID=87120 /ORGANISM="Aurantiochytrium limacinum, Strain ATCCMYA-1381" /LENGTH=1110 /DNA_ID=CAMNT_0012128547 /DNA_START=59 /DNA_END=3387 /DNA_ORIENTATION=-
MIETERLELNSVFAAFEQYKGELLREYARERNRRRRVQKHNAADLHENDPAAWNLSFHDRQNQGNILSLQSQPKDSPRIASTKLSTTEPKTAAPSSSSGNEITEPLSGVESNFSFHPNRMQSHVGHGTGRDEAHIASLLDDDEDLVLEEGTTVLLCIPQELSLRTRPSISDVRSHLLVAAEELRGDFVTVDGRQVIIKGNQVFVGSQDAGSIGDHWAHVRPAWRERMVYVLYSESVETTQKAPTGEEIKISLKIMHIDRPLRGGCASPCTLSGMTLHQIGKYLGVLRSYPEHEIIFEELDEVVAAVLEAWDNEQVDAQFLENVQRLVKGWIRTSSTSLIFTSSSFAPLHRNKGAVQLITSKRERQSLQTQVRRHMLQVEQALEGYVMAQLHDQSMAQLRKLFVNEDAKLSNEAAVLRSRGLNQQDLGMRPEYQCPQDAAIEHLRTLSSRITPLEKLLCLETVVSYINAAVEDNIRRHFVDVSAFQLTTDDLLDQLIYVMVWAEDLEGLMAQIYFMRAFHTMNVNTTSLGYNLANVEVAALWITSHGRDLAATVAERVCESLQPAGPPISRAYRADGDFSQLYLVVDAQNSSREVMLALQGSVGERRRPAVTWQEPDLLENIQQFAASKFSPGVHCWIGRSGRVRVSTGMHHSLLSRQRFCRVACGENHMLAVNYAGQLFAWGDNRDGQVGVGAREERCTSPMWVEFPDQSHSSDNDGRQVVVEVACGARHSLVLTAEQEVWSWGRGTCGRLGLGSRIDKQYLPARVERLSKERIESLAAGWSHSMAVSELGTAFVWGCGGEGRLGLGTVADAYEPKPVNLYGRMVSSVAAGFAHSCFLLRDGTLLACGSAAFGQLGCGKDVLSRDVLATTIHEGSSPSNPHSSTAKESSTNRSVSPRLHDPDASEGSLLQIVHDLLSSKPGTRDRDSSSFRMRGRFSRGSSKTSGSKQTTSSSTQQWQQQEQQQGQQQGQQHGLASNNIDGVQGDQNSSIRKKPRLHRRAGSVGIVEFDQQRAPLRKPFERSEGSDRGDKNPLILRSTDHSASSLVPQLVPNLDKRIVSVDCGRYHTAVVTERNEVLIWGFDEQDDIIIPEPALLRNILPGAAEQVVCGA